MNLYARQENIEKHYGRHFIDSYLDTAIRENPDTEAKVHQGIRLLEDWISEDYYQSKANRLAQLERHNLEQLVRDIFVGICYCQTPELFVSVTAQLANKIHLDDKEDAIRTTAEVVAVLCHTNAFDIIKPDVQAQLLLQSCIPLPSRLLESIQRAEYLPPMVCPPELITGNYQSGYLTLNDSLILGKGNGHTGNLCLDVINNQNQVPMALAVDFLLAVPEEPTHELDTMPKKALWDDFAKTSRELYQLINNIANRFYLTNKVDKRGRLYAQGYHITPQGTAYKKAMIEFAEQEVVEGVPHEFKR